MNGNSLGVSGLKALVLLNGRIFANFHSAPNEAPEVAMGASRGGLTLCDPADLWRHSYFSPHKLSMSGVLNKMRSSPREASPESLYSVGVNKLKDWTLAGGDTLQIRLIKRDAPCFIELGEPITVDVDEPGLALQVYAAMHRAQAVLHIEFQHVETGETTTQKISLQKGRLGGRRPDGYQTIVAQMPPWRGKVEAFLSLEYLRYVNDGSSSDPYMFLAAANVSGYRDRAEAPLYPSIVAGSSIPSDGLWFSARLPAIPVPGDKIYLHSGREHESFLLAPAPEFHVKEQRGHTLIVESQATAALSLYVDGQPDKQIAIQPGQVQVRISERFFDGATHYLSIRDLSGTAPYWEGRCLTPAILTEADVMQRESAAPFPSAIFAQTPRRFANLRAIIEKADANTDFSQITHALETVEGGHENVRLRSLKFPYCASPDVSIVIPAHNKIAVTYLALCSLLIAPNDATFEVIVVDDASTDETAHLEDFVSGVTVIHNETPQRFIRACNAGAEKARGDYIVLLNNDVEVTSGWLDELIAIFGRFDNVGLAGAKLLYPNGQLQDAGGIVWGTGNPWNYGSRQNPDDPRFSYARQVDYLSGAAMMAPKSVWQEVGGLSAYLEPMYFEDTDFSFKVREAGYTTWFVPASVVYHYEGMTSGTDVSTGFKRYQEVNRPKFKRRWAKAYAHLGREGQNPDLEKDRGVIGRVLFIDITSPRPDQDAGSYAAVQEMRLVQSLGYKVSFLPLNMAHMGKYTNDLQKMGVEVLYAPFDLTPEQYLDRRAAEFGVFYITRFYVARRVLQRIRTLAPSAKVLFNNADLHFLREIRAARISEDDDKLEAARHTRDEELKIIDEVDVVLSYNSSEHAVIEAYSEGRAKIRRTPWVVDVPAEAVPLEGRRGLSFLGGFGHPPNAEGIAWFAREVMPLANARQSDLTLSIYGSRMTDEVKALANDAVDPVGFVKDAADAYDRHRVFIAPLLSGAGVKGKVLEALARGTPCVLSPIASEGIGLRHGEDCFIAHTPDEWVEAILRLNADDDLWSRISMAGRAYMQKSYSFETGRIAMREAFEAADIFTP